MINNLHSYVLYCIMTLITIIIIIIIIIIMMIMIMIMIMFFYGLPWITIIQITIVRTMAIIFFFSFVFGLFIFSVLGRKPYSGLGGIEIVDFLKSGKRLQQPDGCSDEM